MSDLPAPIFKRTKSRPNRARPPSPEAENGDKKEDSEQGTGAMGLVAKFKSKQKARAKPQSKLSFGQDEEEVSDCDPCLIRL